MAAPMKLCVFLIVFFMATNIKGQKKGCPSICVCKRGTVYCNHRNLKAVPVEIQPSTKSLYLQGNNFTVIRSNTFANLTNLVRLSLAVSNIHVLEEDAFVGLKKLRYLNLPDNNISQIASKLFQGFSTLQLLDLDDNNIQTLPSGLFIRMFSLKTLHLNNNNISNLEKFAFRGLKNLLDLHLKENSIASISTEAFVGLENLQHLYLNENKLTAVPTASFAETKNLYLLQLADNEIEVLENNAFAMLQQLTYLFLGGNKLKDLPTDPFNALPSLRTLSLHRNQFTGLNTTAFRNLYSLEALDLSNQTMEWIGAVSFVGLVALESLSLYNNSLEILDEDVILPLLQIRSLNLNSNPWRCDCELQGLWEWLQDTTARTRVTCQSPESHRGRELRFIKQSALVCRTSTLAPTGTEHTSTTTTQPTSIASTPRVGTTASAAVIPTERLSTATKSVYTGDYYISNPWVDDQKTVKAYVEPVTTDSKVNHTAHADLSKVTNHGKHETSLTATQLTFIALGVVVVLIAAIVMGVVMCLDRQQRHIEQQLIVPAENDHPNPTVKTNTEICGYPITWKNGTDQVVNNPTFGVDVSPGQARRSLIAELTMEFDEETEDVADMLTKTHAYHSHKNHKKCKKFRRADNKEDQFTDVL
ncbi:Leucine-rich repeats, typical (most populated) sub-containing protein [Branchiostoma belcheri]|nr:Leucine-rich repeats, typical (most populated) sub-containing protein [Branchiostoma belcheri]